MTSSITAVNGQEAPEPEIFDDTMWSNVDASIYGFDAYAKGKTLAEKAAWDYFNELPTGEYKPEFATILPGFVTGEYITGGIASSPGLIKAVMVNSFPGIPRISFACVDVHDVVKAHFNAMFTKQANGQRFILVGETLWLIDICNTLREGLAEDYNYEIAESELNRLPLYIIYYFSSDARTIINRWDVEQKYDN